MNVPKTIDHILETHHAFLRAELPLLAQATAQAPGQLRRPLAELGALLEEHLMKEENILFPLAIALAEGDDHGGCGLEGPLRQMAFEHARIAELSAELRRRRDMAGEAAEQLDRLLDDLDVHARLEDEELFPHLAELSGVSLDPSAEPEPMASHPALMGTPNPTPQATPATPPPAAAKAPAQAPGRRRGLRGLIRRLVGRSSAG